MRIFSVDKRVFYCTSTCWIKICFYWFDKIFVKKSKSNGFFQRRINLIAHIYIMYVSSCEVFISCKNSVQIKIIISKRGKFSQFWSVYGIRISRSYELFFIQIERNISGRQKTQFGIINRVFENGRRKLLSVVFYTQANTKIKSVCKRQQKPHITSCKCIICGIFIRIQRSFLYFKFAYTKIFRVKDAFYWQCFKLCISAFVAKKSCCKISIFLFCIKTKFQFDGFIFAFSLIECIFCIRCRRKSYFI